MDIPSIEAEIESLKINKDQLEQRVRMLEKYLDTRDSNWWKRLWWRIDGFPPWYQVGIRSWRPWH